MCRGGACKLVLDDPSQRELLSFARERTIRNFSSASSCCPGGSILHSSYCRDALPLHYAGDERGRAWTRTRRRGRGRGRLSSPPHVASEQPCDLSTRLAASRRRTRAHPTRAAHAHRRPSRLADAPPAAPPRPPRPGLSMVSGTLPPLDPLKHSQPRQPHPQSLPRPPPLSSSPALSSPSPSASQPLPGLEHALTLPHDARRSRSWRARRRPRTSPSTTSRLLLRTATTRPAHRRRRNSSRPRASRARWTSSTPTRPRSASRSVRPSPSRPRSLPSPARGLTLASGRSCRRGVRGQAPVGHGRGGRRLPGVPVAAQGLPPHGQEDAQP